MDYSYPKIIHQIWFNFTKNNDENYLIKNQKNINSWKVKNSDWKYIFWSLDDALKLIKEEYPHYLHAFNNFKFDICKCDFFRYILMHKFGGLYVDLDFYCLRPIDYLLEQVKFESINKTQKTQENNIILTEEWPNSSKKIDSINGATETIHNGILLSTKDHPFWLLVIDSCISNSILIDGEKDSVYDITGTRNLCKNYQKYNRFSNDIIVLPNYYLCPLTCKFNLKSLFAFPEQNKYIENTSKWSSFPKNINLENIENELKKEIPWSFSILVSQKSTWR